MAIVFQNNARTTLASNISNSATTITVADGSVLPSLTGSDIFYCTIDDGTNNEIVEVTAISSNTLTVVRAQDNTTARAFVTGDLIELRLVAKVLETFPQVETGELTADEFIGDLRGAVIFKAKAGEALSKGDAVYVSGISGNTPVVSLADADFASKMPAFGLALTAASTNGSTEVVTFGTISSIDTSAFSVGDTLYISTTAGELTNSKPTGEGSLIQNIGKVQRSHATAGSIKVGGAGRTNDVPNLNDGNIFIGNASNQATTASLNTKIEDYLDANGTTFPDNVKAIFGTGNDLQIYHDGSHSYVRDVGTGNLKLQGTNLNLQNEGGTKNYLVAVNSGAVQLYHNNNSKIQTTSSGANITGTLTSDGLTVEGNTTFNTGDVLFSGASANILFDQSASALEFGDNAKAQFGAGNDLQIYHDGNNSRVEDTGTGGLRLIGGNFVSLQSTSGENMVVATENGAVTLYHNNSAKLATTSTGIDVTGTVTSDGLTVQTTQGDIAIANSASSLNFTRAGTNYIRATDASGHFKFITGANDFATQRLNIAANGDISFYEDTGTTAQMTWDASADALRFTDNTKATLGSGNDLQIFHDGSNSYINQAGTGSLNIQNNINDADINLISDNGSGGTTTYFKLDGSLGYSRALQNIRFDDNVKAIFGNGNDLQIFHDGTESRIEDSGTGNLVIKATNLELRSYGTNESYLTANQNGAVTLYYDNAAKLATTSTGIDVTGTISSGEITTTAPQFKYVSNTDSNVGLLIRDETYVSNEADITASRLATGSSLTLGLAGQVGINAYIGGVNKFSINSSGNATFAGNISVTGTVDGRDVATDGSKLDGIEAGATADQTASQILTAIKTVDGSGSGLDADLLDGYHKERYHRSALSTFTSGNWNNLTTHGTVKIQHSNFNSDTNPPPASYAYGIAETLEAEVGGENRTLQIYYPHSNGDRAHYIRMFNGSSWTAWRTVPHTVSGAQTVWHSNNDGSGSGLDADLLDGQHGSHYLNYNNFTNTPTIPSLSGYATESYVNTQVSNLVDSAPGTLDTLNELAAALGDDANFSTTVTNSIATKLPLTGGTLSGTLTIDNGNMIRWDRSGGNAHQRADARLDGSDQSRLHWYGKSDSQVTRNFKHAWYDGSGYINVTANGSGRIDFTGTAATMYIGSDRVFADNYHPNADKWTTARTLSLTGAVTGSVSWDGSGNASISTTATADPTLTLSGDASGSATFTNLGNATLSVTVNDDSHNHVISNVDGLQTELNAKLPKSGGTMTGTLAMGANAITSTGAISSGSMRIASGGTTSDAQEGVNYKYYLVGMGVTDGLWKKACDVTIGTGLYKALTMQITLESQNSNYGSSLNTHTSYFSALYNRSGGTQDDTNLALLKGQNTANHELRIVKTATGVYELQIKMLANYKDAIVKIEVLSTNGGSVSVPSSITNGSTTGTAYTATTSTDVKSLYNEIKTASIHNTGVIHNTGTIYLGSTATASDQFATNNGTDIFIGTSSKGLRTYKDLHTNSGNYKYWHAGNDGSGSGLDADLLDGQHGSYYAVASALNASNLTSGTVPNARLTDLFKAGTEIPSGANLNSYRTTGYYSQNSNSDASAGSNYPASLAGMLEVITDDTGNGLHTLQRYARYNNNDTFNRYYYNGTWTSWRQEWNSLNDGSGSGLDADLLDGQHGSHYLNYNNLTNKPTIPSAFNGGTITTDLLISNTSPALNLVDTNSFSDANDRFVYRAADNRVRWEWYDNSAGTTTTVLDLDSTGLLKTDDVRLNAGHTLQRSDHHSGHLEGSYNNVAANGSRTNPIYTIGSSYNPSSTTLSNMYGIGFCHANQAGFVSLHGTSGWGMYVASGGSASIFLDGQGGTIHSAGQHYVGSSVVWNAGNDGSGSGLDADLLDGVHGSSFLRSDADDTMSEKLTFSQHSSVPYMQNPGGVTFSSVSAGDGSIVLRNLSEGIRFQTGSNWDYNSWAGLKFDSSADIMYIGGPAASQFTSNAGPPSIDVNFVGLNSSGLKKDGNVVWHAGNDGSGSGLDADTLDGVQASGFLQAGGGWSGANMPGSRYTGLNVNGGEVAFLRDNPNTSQMSILVDGAFYAGENNGFYSLYSANSYNSKSGFYADTSGRLQFSGQTYAQFNTQHGNIKLGPMNSSYAHIYTDTAGGFYFNKTALYADGNTMWHAGNDGAGSGLDADTLDGVNGASYLRSDASDTYTGTLTLNGQLDLSSSDTAARYIHMPRGGGITLYGDTSHHHGIFSRNIQNQTADDILISSYGALYIDLDSNNNNSSDADFVIGRHNVNNQNKFSVSGEDGDTIASGDITAFGSPSDIRLKENIEVIADPLSKVSKLRGVTFNYKSTGKKSTGLIAQELEEVLPEVVYETHDIDDKNDKFKAVRYGNIVGLLVEAIKEQQDQIEYMKEEIQNLKGEK